jgi:hypothetical protein
MCCRVPGEAAQTPQMMEAPMKNKLLTMGLKKTGSIRERGSLVTVVVPAISSALPVPRCRPRAAAKLSLQVRARGLRQPPAPRRISRHIPQRVRISTSSQLRMAVHFQSRRSGFSALIRCGVDVARVIGPGPPRFATSALISTVVPFATVRSRKCWASSPTPSKVVRRTSTRSASIERPISTWNASAVAPPPTIPLSRPRRRFRRSHEPSALRTRDRRHVAAVQTRHLRESNSTASPGRSRRTPLP